MTKKGEKVENLRQLLEQHWMQCRHIENERSSYLIYGAVTGGISAFAYLNLNTTAPSNYLLFYFVLSFLIIVNYFGFLLTLRWIYGFEYHRQQVNSIIEKLLDSSPEYENKKPDMTVPAILFLPEHIITSTGYDTFNETISGFFFGTRYLFPLFYLVFISFGTCFLIISISNCYAYRWFFMLLPLIPFLIGIRWYFALLKLKSTS